MDGSFGNATSLLGCKSCQCNDHGDPEQNYCEKMNGSCFCKNYTSGTTCSKCIHPFVGEPTRYGIIVPPAHTHILL